jgi:hypothetical protein
VFRYPFRGSVAVASGQLTTAQLRGPRFRRLFPDVYIAADVTVDHYVMCRAAALYAGPAAVVSGLSAAYIWGVDRQPQAVELTIPPTRHRRLSGVQLIRSNLTDDDTAMRRGLCVTSAARTTLELLLRLPRTDAVIGADAMLARTGLTAARLDAYVSEQRGLHGIRAARDLVALLEPLTESPMESVCRLLIVDNGLPRPIAQHVIRYNELTLARLDFAYPQWKLGLEYEGDYHRDRGTFRRDIARYRGLENLGWKIIRITGDDILRNPDELVGLVRHWIKRRSGGEN